jgi:hypothetical protein
LFIFILLKKILLIAFYCGIFKNLTNYRDCHIDKASVYYDNIKTNFFFNETNIISLNLNNQNVKIEIILNSISYLNYITFFITNDANISVFSNQNNSMVIFFLFFLLNI